MNSKTKSKKTKPKPLFPIGTLPARSTAAQDVVSFKKTEGRIYEFDLPIIPYTIGVVAGVCTTRTQFVASAVTLLSRLILCFAEARFRGVRLNLRVSTSNDGAGAGIIASGWLDAWIDDAVLTTAATVNTDAQSRAHVELPLNSTVRPDSRKEIQWVATDVEDQDWVLTKSGAFASLVPFTIGTFAGTGYSTGTGTVAGTTATIVISGSARIQCRQLVYS